MRSTILIVAFSCLVINGCSFFNHKYKKELNSTEKVKKQDMEKDPFAEYVDNYTITPNTAHSKFASLVQEFKKEEHRFEFNLCEYKYNGQSFFFGTSAEEIEAVFGKPDEKYVFDDQNMFSYTYDKLDLYIRFDQKDSKLISFKIRIYAHGEDKNVYFTHIIFRGVPYRLDMTLNGYMELSDLSHDKLRRNNQKFFMFQKECPPTKDTRIYTYIDSEAAYDYEGGGHLTFRGDFMPEVSAPIRMLEFSMETLEEYKR